MRRLVSVLSATTLASVAIGAATGALHWLRMRSAEREQLELRRDALLEQLRLTSASRRKHKQVATLYLERMKRTHRYQMDELLWMKACDLSRGSRIRARRAQEAWNDFCREHPEAIERHLRRRRSRWFFMHARGERIGSEPR